MPQVFKCESCSGPLEYEGGKTQKCGFCGSTILVPRYLYSDDPTVDHSAEPRPNELADLTQKAFIFAEIKKLIASGNKIHAIKLYHEKFGVGLAEAKDAVDKLERGEPIAFGTLSLKSIVEPISKINIETAAVRRVGGYLLTFLVLGVLALFVVGAVIVGTWLNTRTATDAAQSDKPATDPVLLKMGGEGTGVGRFTDNRVVTVDDRGQIYSTDYHGGRIQIFDAAGKFVKQWIAVDADNVYAIAADRAGHLLVLSNKGVIKYVSADGTEKNRYEDARLRDIHVKPDGSVIAVGRHGILFLDPELKLIKQLREASADADASFGFESVTADATGKMFLLDRKGKDIIIFSPEGKFLNRIPTEINSANDIALDPAGNIYIAETNRIRVFSSTGKELAGMTTSQAFGLAFNDAGELFVASRPFVVKMRPPI